MVRIGGLMDADLLPALKDEGSARGDIMMSYLADRLIQFYEDFEGFCRWIKTMEQAGAIKSVKIDSERKIVSIKGKVGGIDGISTGLSRSVDPINNLVLLGFAFFGEYWIYMPDVKQAFKKVNKWWKEQIKKK
jgi:hypothetical protein